MSDAPSTLQVIRHNLISCTSNNKELMKILVHNCFPLTYKDDFYDKIVRSYKDTTRFITVNDIVVGGIVARVEVDDETHETYLHLLVLLVLEKYRRFGLASIMMDWLFQEIKRLQMTTKYASLHVQSSNKSAVQFYLKHGFKIIEELENYYTGMEDSNALHMRREL